MVLKRVKSLLRPCPDFPKPGILFQDIFPIFQDPEATREIIDFLKNHLKSLEKIDTIVGKSIM